MPFIKTLSVMALAAGAVIATPAPQQKFQWRSSNRRWQSPSPDAEVTVTGYTPLPINWSVNATSTVLVVSATPTYGGDFFDKPSPVESTPIPEAASAPAQTSASPPSSSQTSNPSTGGSGGQDDYMSVVSKWRAAGGLSPLQQDSTLEGNAMKTAQDSGGQLIHEVNPGTLAQVLAPGDDSNFESVYVGGWLCEVPSLPGLDGICSTMAQGWDHSDGETGHADILTSSSYNKIGCALADGIWACDLA